MYAFKGGSDGASPYAGLINLGGVLFGTTYLGGGAGASGTVFKVTLAGTESVVHSFKGAGDGAYPEAGLINVDGTLYSTTQAGGATGNGTVFGVTKAGAETVLYSFKGGSDGAYPVGGLIDVGGLLFGTTNAGGSGSGIKDGYGYGTVFSVTLAGAETVLYSFNGASDGCFPDGSLIDVDGTLYGTTEGSAAINNYGTVYSVTTAGAETVLYSFKGPSDGASPFAGLLNVGGFMLYGTTRDGGAFGNGTVFRVKIGGAEKVVYSFGYGDAAASPYAPLINVGGTLYGTTENGGDSNLGTVFKVTKTGVETVVYSFKGGTDGANPVAGLIDVGGTLYGTTSAGGASGHGTVFAVTP